MTDDLATLSAHLAEAHGLDPADLAARVRAQLARRARRGRQAVKRCGDCGEVRPLFDFAADRSRPDGAQRRCRPCDSARQAARRASPTRGA
ncbi:hypothetical protein [Micromonospora okii]|uniref:hypothetical protein n=1 Tax=Micromonospora okii TaxID=1182970 RepID=UPI001E34B09F|nr:hypothetical protein [Micromonospora okii]